MKKILKWFTLVEILIVIVIIGILIWALVPRMQSAQWRARDVARKNDLSQLQAAIITSSSDRGEWPAIDGVLGDNNTDHNAKNWLTVDKLESELFWAWLNGIPTDPITSNTVVLGNEKADLTTGNYWYLVAKKNWVENAWFLLMAHMEVEWGANWVYCEDLGSDNTEYQLQGVDGVVNGDKFRNWNIKNDDDLREIVSCQSMIYHRWAENQCGVLKTDDLYWNVCHYDDPKELRYILMY